MTTDGIRRKPQIAQGAQGAQSAQGAKVDVAKDAKVDAANANAVPSETAGGASAKRALGALDALDALDDVKGTTNASKGKQGVHAALVGLAAVEAKPKKWSWRAAVSGALLGFTLLGGLNPIVARDLRTARLPNQTTTLVEKNGAQNALNVRIVAAGGGPPDSRPRYELTYESIGAKPTVILKEAAPGVVDVDVAEVRRIVESERASSTTPATTTPVVQSVRGGLPDTLATLHTGMTVVHGSDPGDFYCEHAFFTTTAAAFRADTSILKNAHGEVLTGFLHVPSDAFTYTTANQAEKVQAERHSERRDIVGAAIRGFYEDARPQLDNNVDGGAFRMLLTGYLQWGSVVDNPTGDFTGHTENVDAAMRRAFGSDLLTREGRVVDTRENAAGMKSTTLEYRVTDAKASNGVRVIFVEAAQLPVTDAAINGGDASLQRLIERGRPHAVMSMGVAGGSAYQAEFHADDGGLRVDGYTGAITHDDGKSPSTNHPDNYALGRAIHRGHELIDARPIVIATSTVVRGGD